MTLHHPHSQAFLPTPHAAASLARPAAVRVLGAERVQRNVAACRPARFTMLRVQDKRRPEDWEKRTSGLSGRFLPMDPRDEAVFDILENKTPDPLDEPYGPEGPPSHAYADAPVPVQSRKWSKRSEAARKRWADPEYRANMLEKRAAKRRANQQKDDDDPKGHKLEIGCMDSITLADDSRAQKINTYARSLQLRSEKITAFHHNRKLWMETRLKDSPRNLSEEQRLEKKIERQEKRRQVALKRARIKRATHLDTPEPPSAST